MTQLNLLSRKVAFIDPTIDDNVTILDVLIINNLRDDCLYSDDSRYTEYCTIKDLVKDIKYCYGSLICGPCKNNLPRLKIAEETSNLKQLIKNWNIPKYDKSSRDIPKNIIQSKEEFDKKYSVEFKNKCQLMEDFNSPLTDIDKYLEYDFIDFGWAFNFSLEPLIKLKNLKGIKLGGCFTGDLSILQMCKQLKYIEVDWSYDKRIPAKLLDITFIK